MRNILREKTKLSIILLVIILLISMTLAVAIGPVKIKFVEVWGIILSKINIISSEKIDVALNIENIVWKLRLPRVLLGIIVGAGLSLSGVSMQAFTKNPLADPYVLGISSGASAGAVLAVLTSVLDVFGIFSLPIGAFMGALISIVLVYFLAKSKEGILPIRLILTGVAISSLFSALTNYLIFNAENESGIRNATFWMMGGLSGTKWIYLIVPGSVFLISFIVMMICSNSLNAMLMGENTANVLGIDVRKIRNIIIFISALLTGSIVAVSGSIGFVGLIIPHIVRSLVGSDHRKVIPISVLFGAIFMVWADVVARVIAAPADLPIGIITAIIGAPFFIWLVKKNNYAFGE